MKYPDKDKLIQLCKSAVKRKAYVPRDGKTYCNIAVTFITITYVKETDFKGKLANEISDILKDDSYWTKVSMGVAHHYCDEGYLVIAHVKKKGHGHVVVLYPGKKVNSKKWKRWVPRCVNIGKKNWIDKGINHAFVKIPTFHIFDIDALA